MCAPRREDLQDERGAIDDLAVPRAFQIALLHRGQRAVHDHQSEPVRRDRVRHRRHPPGTEERRRPGLLHRHDLRQGDLEVDGAGKARRLGQATLGLAHGLARAPAAPRRRQRRMQEAGAQ